MIIGVTGATKVGKSTYIEDFMDTYSKYVTPEETYRDIPDLDLYESGTEESQRKIRDFMFKQAKEAWSLRDTKKWVIQDRTLLDNLAVTMFLYSKNDGTISDEFLIESMEMTKKAMTFYHLIYFIPVTQHDKIPIPESIDTDFRNAFDIILKTIYNAYQNRDPLADDIFPEKNSCMIDQIYGNREARMLLASSILDEDGQPLGGFEETATPSVYGKDGREITEGRVDSEFKLEDFGFSEDEASNAPLI